MSNMGRNLHRQLDRQSVAAEAREDAEFPTSVKNSAPGGQDIHRPKRWRQDAGVSSGQQSKVLLLTLSERTSARGNKYLRRWLGRAAVVAFRGEKDEGGHETWDVYVSTPEPCGGYAGGARRRGSGA
jgi:hypothetical protein